MPKVSVIVPIYNVEKYLRECLESLFMQTLKDIEIICINDGSTDSSVQILEEYSKKDKRFKIINKENTGYGASMNVGLNAAAGEYIGIVEPDDFVKPEMFEELYKTAKKYDLDIVKSDYYKYFGENNQARKAGMILKGNCDKVFDIKDNSMILKMMPSVWSAVYRKAFLFDKNIKFLETEGASYQDTSFSFKALSLAERILFTSKAYVYYRCDNEQSSVKRKDKVFYICDEYDEIERFLDENPKIKSIANEVKLIKQFSTYKWNAIRLDEQFRDDFLERFRSDFKKYYENGEIGRKFYTKIKPKELKMLLFDKRGYRKYIDFCLINHVLKEKRRRRFSVRINNSRISIVLFGKQVVEIG